MNLTVDLRAFPDNALFYYGFRSQILRLDIVTLGVDLPVLLVKIKFRDQIDQFHICFPVGTQCSDIFPVTVIFVSKQSLALFMAIRDDVFSEIAVALVFHRNQRFF